MTMNNREYKITSVMALAGVDRETAIAYLEDNEWSPWDAFVSICADCKDGQKSAAN
jgi:hypothetical protein